MEHGIMKAIINGLRYDTDKAVCIGEADHGSYPQDGNFSSWTAGLYRTPRSGRYFLAGKGGGMTQFAEHIPGGGRCGGEGIRPMDAEDALEWAEQYLTAEEIEKAFGEKLEDA
jgi:hypothetical protein